MTTKKTSAPDNTKAEPMTYEIRHMPNLRQQYAQQIAEENAGTAAPGSEGKITITDLEA